MKRRTIIRLAGILSMSSFVPHFKLEIFKNISHYVSFSFDDGFRKSFLRAAEIHETYGLKAALNVIATGHLPEFDVDDAWIANQTLGDFNDWNLLASRGHSIMPHTWQHLNLTKIPLSQAKENIDKCLEYFENNLDGYENEKSIYHFAYNASNDDLHKHVLSKVLGLRTSGKVALKEDQLYNLTRISQNNSTLGCWAKGPDLCDVFLENTVNKFLETKGGWLIINLHGFDNEGWGPVSTKFYDNLLKRLTKISHLRILPESEILLLNQN